MSEQMSESLTLMQQLKVLNTLQTELINLTTHRQELLNTIGKIDERRCGIIGVAYKPQRLPKDSLLPKLEKIVRGLNLPVPSEIDSTVAAPATSDKKTWKQAHNPVKLYDQIVALLKTVPGHTLHISDLTAALLRAGWKTNAKNPKDVVRMAMHTKPKVFKRTNLQGHFKLIRL